MSLQQRIQSFLDERTAAGIECGVQFVAYRDGQLIVDVASGVTDPVTKQPVTGDTLFPVFSVSKGITSTLVHQIVERGGLTYDTPIAKVWPEFAANGKEDITLRQALTHSSGLPHMPSGIGFAELCDWNYMCRALAAQTPSWKPGTRIEYHAMTFGWIVGEVARRVTSHATFESLLEEKISRPLGLTGLYIGLPAEVKTPIAILEEPNATEPVAPLNGLESVPAWMGPLYAIMNRDDLRHACLPASSGIMNARSLARHYAAVLPGGIDGVELLPPSRVKLATEPQRLEHAEGDYEKDWGLGYKLSANPADPHNRFTEFGHGGYGGAKGFADIESRLAIGFTKNLYTNQDTLAQLVALLKE